LFFIYFKTQKKKKWFLAETLLGQSFLKYMAETKKTRRKEVCLFREEKKTSFFFVWLKQNVCKKK